MKIDEVESKRLSFVGRNQPGAAGRGNGSRSEAKHRHASPCTCQSRTNISFVEATPKHHQFGALSHPFSITTVSLSEPGESVVLVYMCYSGSQRQQPRLVGVVLTIYNLSHTKHETKAS